MINKVQYAECARIIREKLILLNIKKKKIIEDDKNATSLELIETEHNELISAYNYYAKKALKDRNIHNANSDQFGTSKKNNLF